jgi:hypothetical protein
MWAITKPKGIMRESIEPGELQKALPKMAAYDDAAPVGWMHRPRLIPRPSLR